MQQNDQKDSSTPASPINHSEEIEKAVEAQGAAFEEMARVAFSGLIKKLKETKERKDAKKEIDKEENTKEH